MNLARSGSIPPSASCCSFDVDGSKKTAAVPSPSWIALGQENAPPKTAPAMSTSPIFPSVTRKATTARQFLQNVCAQLILRYDLPYPMLPPQAAEDGGFLSQLLSEAADVGRASGQLPVVIACAK